MLYEGQQLDICGDTTVLLQGKTEERTERGWPRRKKIAHKRDKWNIPTPPIRVTLMFD